MSDVKTIFKELNELRFCKLIHYENSQEQIYIKGKIRENDKEKRWIRRDNPAGVCCECKNTNIVSHGIHSYDLFNIYNEHNKQNKNYDNFHKDGVLFVLENPSNNESTCYKEPIGGKRVAQGWWWLDNGEAETMQEFPQGFDKSKSYGDMFNSVINTFRLENAYITNFVKCGKQENGKFRNLYDYDSNELENCFEKFLIEEIKIIKPKVIFALGKDVFNLLDDKKNEINKVTDEKLLIIRLPHPNSRITNEDRKTLLYCKILKGLIKSNVITDFAEKEALWKKFFEEEIKKKKILNKEKCIKKILETRDIQVSNCIIMLPIKGNYCGIVYYS